MDYSIKIKRGETIVYIILWLIVLLMPVFFSQSDGSDWKRIIHEWIKIIPFLIIFLLHNYLLFPTFLMQKRYLLYFASTIFIILGISAITMLFVREVGPNRGILPQPMDLPRHPPKPMAVDNLPSIRLGIWQMLMFNDFIISILVIGFNSAIKLTIIWQAEEQKNKELEKQKLETELAFLKNQISPHFFMNTLNNIHALIDINSEDAKDSVIKLSKLMRYLLYDSDDGKTTLAKEIEFIKSYIDLMKLRFTRQVKVNLSFPETLPNLQIPPMLFTSLLENAFKHGVSYQSESSIEIVMKTDNKSLYFRIKNSKNTNENGIDEPGGIGLENLRKRLDLIYSNQYVLEQREDKDTFEINIKLPLNG